MFLEGRETMERISRIWSFRARAGRLEYFLVSLVGGAFIAFAFFNALYVYRWTPTLFLPAILIATLLCILFGIAGWATAVRRLHDREKSWLWLLLYYLVPAIAFQLARAPELQFRWLLVLVSLAIQLGAFVELTFLRGTDSANKYGEGI